MSTKMSTKHPFPPQPQKRNPLQTYYLQGIPLTGPAGFEPTSAGVKVLFEDFNSVSFCHFSNPTKPYFILLCVPFSCLSIVHCHYPFSNVIWGFFYLVFYQKSPVPIDMIAFDIDSKI